MRIIFILSLINLIIIQSAFGMDRELKPESNIFEGLPNELEQYILEFLSKRDLVLVAILSSSGALLFESAWQRLYVQFYETNQKPNSLSWKNAYRLGLSKLRDVNAKVFLEKKQLKEAKKDRYLAGAMFAEHPDLKDVVLSDAYLLGTGFAVSTLTNASFENSVVTGANFTRAMLIEANFTNALAKNTKFAHANVTKSNFSRADLRGANFSNANICKAQFNNARIDGADFRFSFRCSQALVTIPWLKSKGAVWDENNPPLV